MMLIRMLTSMVGECMVLCSRQPIKAISVPLPQQLIVLESGAIFLRLGARPRLLSLFAAILSEPR
jgi:hypothetical protein